jgi:maltokinase
MTLTYDALQPLVARWLPSQRWYAGKGQGVTDVSLQELAALTEAVPEVRIWLVTVTYADGLAETYQLPLVARAEPLGSLEHVLLGTVQTPDGTRWIYDALHDKDVTGVFVDGVRKDAAPGPVHFQRYVDPSDLPLDQPSLVLTGEQSNTSLVYGDQAILKVFRRLESGINPDIEVHQALSELGAKHIARLLGSMTADVGDDADELVAPTSLAMLQEFMSTASNGWDLAKTSVRDLMAEADLHAAEAGGDFAAEAERLGAATAVVHSDLALAFGTDVMPADQLRERAAAMHARLDEALANVPLLGPVEPGLRAAFDAVGSLAGTAEPVLTQRIHGDLHLGQALRTARRWILLDFEGEPMVPLAERRSFDSPLRDVAGMLRSFDYAAWYQIVDAPDPQLAYRATEWAERNRDAFCTGYADVSGLDPRVHDVLLRGFEADKAVYEAVYETRNRPTWVQIPLASLARLAEPDGAGYRATDESAATDTRPGREEGSS